jgi:hypothetical protein
MHTGPEYPLGTLTLAGRAVEVSQHGDTAAASDMGFELTVSGDPAGVGVFIWLEDVRQRQVSPSRTDDAPTDGRWHVHLMSEKPEDELAWVVVRVRLGGADERGRVSLQGVGAPPPHGGVVAGCTDANGATVGSAELRRDVETGALTLWLYQGQGYATPWRVPDDAVVTAIFVTPTEQTVRLEPQEAPAGRWGFPGGGGGDSAWLAGAEFDGLCNVRIVVGDRTYDSDPLVLGP